jgi:hypothetical protein
MSERPREVDVPQPDGNGLGLALADVDREVAVGPDLPQDHEAII